MTRSATENVAQGQSPPPPAGPGRSETEGESRRRAGRRVLAIGTLIVVALAGALAVGTLPRLRQQQQLDAATTQAAAQPPRVTVAVAQRMAPANERVLPGNSLPLMEASLYARATGYLSKRLVDIGDRVQAGQLLAEIAAPDIDDQLAQAKANLAQARANLPLAEANAEVAKVTLDRLVKSGPGTGATLLQIDQQRATVKTTAAQVEATKASIQVNEAAVQRFTDLQGFEKITAPFAGVITARNVETGDLITADSTNQELFLRLGSASSMDSPPNEEWRRPLSQPDLTDDEIEEFRRDLRAFLGAFLDEYFRQEFGPDPDDGDSPGMEPE
jgi:multidrug efflux pump subunit AcrA (membrane-fusion protein)